MASTFRGLLPSGQLPSVAEQQVRSLIQTEAPPPDLSAYPTTADVDEKIVPLATKEEVVEAVESLATKDDLASARDDLTVAIEEIEQVPDGNIPVFATMARARAWEAANPGRVALTIEWQTPDTTPPRPGGLRVVPSDTSALLDASAATDDRGVTGYSFRVDGGAWSAWQEGPLYTATGLARSTEYAFQHRVRDTVHTVEGAPFSATTLDVALVPYDQQVRLINPAFYLPGNGLVNEGTGSAKFAQSSNASDAGAALAGWATSRSVQPGGYDRFTTEAPMPEGDSPRPFGTAIVVRYNAYAMGGLNQNTVDIAAGGASSNDARLIHASRDTSSSPEWSIRTGTHIIVGPIPMGQTHTGTYVAGLDYDGTTARYYINGTLVHTKDTALTWSGFRNTVNGPASSGEGSIEWRGWVLHTAPLGAGTHLALADAAGLA